MQRSGQMREMNWGEIPAGEDYLLCGWYTRKEPCQHNYPPEGAILLPFLYNVQLLLYQNIPNLNRPRRYSQVSTCHGSQPSFVIRHRSGGLIKNKGAVLFGERRFSTATLPVSVRYVALRKLVSHHLMEDSIRESETLLNRSTLRMHQFNQTFHLNTRQR